MIASLSIGTVSALWAEEIVHENKLVADEVKGSIVENFPSPSMTGDVTKEVSFTNSGTAAAFLRVAYSETWTKKSGSDDVMLNNSVNGTDVATKNWSTAKNADWVDGGDGWLYYKKLLNPGETTEKILQSVSFPDYTQDDYKAYKDADYQLYFRMELLQASDSHATLNKDKVNEDSTSTVFGKKATVSGTNVTWE